MDIFEKLKELIADKLNVAAEKITLETNFKIDLKADSIDLFELVMSMEDTFGVELTDEDVMEIETVEDVVRFIKNNM